GNPWFPHEPPPFERPRGFRRFGSRPLFLACDGTAVVRLSPGEARLRRPLDGTHEATPSRAGRLMPGANVPFPPMEAELVRELPTTGEWRYEPKWDGFRGILENDGGELALWSRNGRPLPRS